jgi:F-type H+-transporting ATPase subunit delta
MKDRVVATRYARALSQTLRTREDLEATSNELDLVSGLLEADARLRSLLESPALPATQRSSIVEEIITAAQLSEKTARFLRLLDEHDRLPLIEEIASSFTLIRDERIGIVEAELTTAVPLDETASAEWQSVLARISGQNVRLKKRVDPEIIGGAVARIGSLVYDGSLKSRLTALRRRMIGG